MSLAEILETVATALPDYAEAIRPANGDPSLLLDALGPEDGSEVLTWLLVHEPDAAAELANVSAELARRLGRQRRTAGVVRRRPGGRR